MRVITYNNPFKLRKSKELWSLLQNCPQFCASDTLVQGLNTEYGRSEFNILRTVNDLAESVIGEFLTLPQIEMQLYISVLDEIRTIEDQNMRRAFRNNVNKVMKTIRMLLLLDCNESLFAEDVLTNEQKVFLRIYKSIKQIECLNSLWEVKQITKEEFYYRVKSTMYGELQYIIGTKKEYSEIGLMTKITSENDFLVTIGKLILHIEQNMESVGDDLNKYSNRGYDLRLLRHILDVYQMFDINKEIPIIINGIHKFSPELLFIIELAKKLDIELIFVINYAANYKGVFNTWDKMYSWIDCDFENVRDIEISEGTKFGSSFAGVFEGSIEAFKGKENLILFPNITSFTDGEVRKQFKKAKERVGIDKALSSMSKQYYAVSGDESNKILKNYFPEQFNYKPFLSYPIGQFVQGIYEMWDFDNQHFSIDWNRVRECIVSGIYTSSIELIDVFEKTRLYFEDIETMCDFEIRLGKLYDAIYIVNRNEKFDDLRYVSFFDCTRNEVEELGSFVTFLKMISEKLFEEQSRRVDFRLHFKRLMEIIDEEVSDDSLVSEDELFLVKEFLERLSYSTDNGKIEGNIQDVKEALYFFLSDRNNNDSSKWIVRGFEQLDGSVLHRKRKGKKAKDVIHLAMVSNEKMVVGNSDNIPWPLTERMLESYMSLESSIKIINLGIKENSNYLRYLLFYATFFTKGKIELSYVQLENGNKQKPYSIFKIMGVQVKEKFLTNKRISKSFEENEFIERFDSDVINLENKEIFSVCPYKFFHIEVLHGKVLYYSKFHIEYFVKNYVMNQLNINKRDNENTVTKQLCGLMESIKKIFVFWNDSVFVDIENSSLSSALKQIDYLNQGNRSGNAEIRRRRKNNFLIAQWKDPKTQESYMSFNSSNEDIVSYMIDKDLIKRDLIPYEKICENCNYNKVCLFNYSSNYSLD